MNPSPLPSSEPLIPKASKGASEPSEAAQNIAASASTQKTQRLRGLLQKNAAKIRTKGQKLMDPFAKENSTSFSSTLTTSNDEDTEEALAGRETQETGDKKTGDIVQTYGENWWLMMIFFILCITVLGVSMAMTRTALFHTKAIGRWDNGHPSNFSYTWPLTLLNFAVMTGAGLTKFVSKRIYKWKAGEKRLIRFDCMDKLQGKMQHGQGNAYINWKKKYGLVLLQAVLEIISQWCTSWALVCGVPATLAVVFRNAGCIMMGICSKVLGRKGAPDTYAQWTSFIVIWVGLLVAAVAEGRGGGRGGRRGGGQTDARGVFLGICLMLLGEFVRSLVLILQAVQLEQTVECQGIVVKYWADPVDLGAASASVGFVQTMIIMYFMRDVTIPSPSGGIRPQNDITDFCVMCVGCPFLAVLLIGHVVTQIGSELGHMYILRYMTVVGRSICDVLKIPTMWLVGKLIWKSGALPPLAEPWKPGLLGSWLMLPAIVIISYGMLMFKEKTFRPLRSMYDDDRDKTAYELQQGDSALLGDSQADQHAAGDLMQQQTVILQSQRIQSMRANSMNVTNRATDGLHSPLSPVQE